jgi:hypothetical protein
VTGCAPRRTVDEAWGQLVEFMAAAFNRRHPEWHAMPQRPGQPPPPGSRHLPLFAPRPSAPDDGQP